MSDNFKDEDSLEDGIGLDLLKLLGLEVDVVGVEDEDDDPTDELFRPRTTPTQARQKKQGGPHFVMEFL